MSTKFTNDHEWAKTEGEVVVVGITNFAQEQLGEVVFVELPDVGQDVSQGEEIAVIESVKAAGEVKSPMSGTIASVNEALTDSPEKVNEDPEGDGWVYKLTPSHSEEQEGLMDLTAYQAYLETLA